MWNINVEVKLLRLEYFSEYIVTLTHLFQMHPFSTPENIRKPYGFFMFSGGTKRVD